MQTPDQRRSDRATPRSPAVAPETVLRGRDIVCFSPDWNGDPLSKTHLMRLLSRENRILWVNSVGVRTPTVSKSDISRALGKLAAAASRLREPEPNIFVLSPLVIPAYGKPLIRAFNRRLLQFQVKRAMRGLAFQRPINWVFIPPAGIVAGSLREDMVIYQCVDEYAAFTGVPSRSLAKLEEQLLRRADLVIVSAERLYHAKAQVNPNTILVRHGVDHPHFRRALDPATVVPPELAHLPRPILGFFGLLADWVDMELVAHVARRFPHGSVVLIGKATTDVSLLEGLPNVHLLGRKQYRELPAYCKGFDVALMPFRINELTLNANPLKVREYLASGLPVVSTPIPEVEVLEMCRIGRDREAFVREIEAALENPGPCAARSDAVRDQSWEARLDEIRRSVASLQRRRSGAAA